MKRKYLTPLTAENKNTICHPLLPIFSPNDKEAISFGHVCGVVITLLMKKSFKICRVT